MLIFRFSGIAIMISWPSCASKHTVKNGRIHSSKQHYRCRDCGRQFVQDPQTKPIDQATKDLIDKLLLERLSLAEIARVTGVSELWLQRYVNAKYAAVSRSVSAKKGAINDSMRRVVVVRNPQGEQAVVLVSHRCQDA